MNGIVSTIGWLRKRQLLQNRDDKHPIVRRAPACAVRHHMPGVPLREEEMFMAFPGCATPEGTARYAARLQGTVAQEHFREFGLKIHWPWNLSRRT